MVRISDIVNKIRNEDQNEVKEVNKERRSVEDGLREMNRKMKDD